MDKIDANIIKEIIINIQTLLVLLDKLTTLIKYLWIDSPHKFLINENLSLFFAINVCKWEIKARYNNIFITNLSKKITQKNIIVSFDQS